INPRANKLPMWYDPEFGVEFFVGEKQEPYGADLDRLVGPRYADGWLPIVQTAYRVGDAMVEQEAFGSVQDSATGTVFVQFTVREAATTITARLRNERPLA